MHLPYQMYFVSNKITGQADYLVICFNILEDRCSQKKKQYQQMVANINRVNLDHQHIIELHKRHKEWETGEK